MEKYKLVYQDLFYKIKSGEYSSGTVLPTETILAKEYNVSKITVKTALDLLKAKGLVIRRKRLGTVVKRGVINGNGEKFIAIVFPDFDNIDTRITAILNEIATEKNVKISFFDSNDEINKEREILTYLLSQKLSGLIIMPTTKTENVDVLSMFLTAQIPTVCIDFVPYGIEAPVIASNNYDGMYNLANYLVSIGHTAIGYYPFCDNMYQTESDRFRGYLSALATNGISVSKDFLFKTSAVSTYHIINSVSKDDKSIGEDFVSQYEKLSAKPTAVMCVNDSCAGAVVSALNERGYKVPEDISVTGFDNLAFSNYYSLTTVSQNFAEIYKTALTTLINRIEGKNVSKLEVKIKTFTIHRSSVKNLK